MAGLAETRRPQPVEDQETARRHELSKRVYETTTKLVGKISATQEFIEAVSMQYFGRTGAMGGPLDYGVYFPKDGFFYKVRYKAEPGVHDHDQNATTHLKVDRYDPRKKDEYDYPKAVGSVDLTATFTENSNGKVLTFLTGDAIVEDESGKYYGVEALDKIPDILGDFSPKPAQS